MPTWITKFIEEATPMVELAPAAAALGRAIAEELQSADDIGEKLAKISDDIAIFAELPCSAIAGRTVRPGICPVLFNDQRVIGHQACKIYCSARRS